MRSIILAIMMMVACGRTCTGLGKTLTDTTFEHDTQASTGQTTGTWAIRFCGLKESCGNSEEEWEALRDDMLEKDIFLATVNLGKEVGLAKRFQGYVDDDPIVLMLRRGSMYVHTLDFEDIVQWMVSGWEKEEPLEVPKEIGLLGEKSHVMMVLGLLASMMVVLLMKNMLMNSSSHSNAERLSKRE